MRREFTKAIKRDAFLRAKGCCEATLPDGKRCNIKLDHRTVEYDHEIPDALGGEPALSNCVVSCKQCHRTKTSTLDIPAIAKTKRIQDREMGIRKGPQIKSAGFRKAPPQNSATRPLTRHQTS